MKIIKDLESIRWMLNGRKKIAGEKHCTVVRNARKGARKAFAEIDQFTRELEVVGCQRARLDRKIRLRRAKIAKLVVEFNAHIEAADAYTAERDRHMGILEAGLDLPGM